VGHGRVLREVKSEVGVTFIKDMLKKYSELSLMGI
jgi:hypothetical protein